MSGEEYLARKYCEPTPHWHCLRELSGGNHYTFDELNYPEYWLDAVAKYIQAQPSAALKQLHRRVEAGRAEFRAKQERIYSGRKLVSETESLKDIYRREDKAWDDFNAYKQDCLRDYLQAIQTGKLETHRARRRHRCQGDGCSELLSGKVKFCDICKRARNREAARSYRKRNQLPGVISCTREISPQKAAFGYRDTSEEFLSQGRPSKCSSASIKTPYKKRSKNNCALSFSTMPQRRSFRGAYDSRKNTFTGSAGRRLTLQTMKIRTQCHKMT